MHHTAQLGNPSGAQNRAHTCSVIKQCQCIFESCTSNRLGQGGKPTQSSYRFSTIFYRAYYKQHLHIKAAVIKCILEPKFDKGIIQVLLKSFEEMLHSTAPVINLFNITDAAQTVYFSAQNVLEYLGSKQQYP